MGSTRKCNCPNNHKYLAAAFPLLLFISSVLLSIFTTWNVTGNFLDADASSELVLAKHLAETGQILSRDWVYSTELRVLNTQLIYAPLFLIFDDWHVVRFCGAILLQVIYILCYSFLLHEAGFNRRFFFLSASLLLLPVSVTYGRILLYHCYYIPHIALSFFLTGLFLGFVRESTSGKMRRYVRLLILLGAAFVGGLGGIRQLMVTHAPLLLSLLLACILQDTDDNLKTPALLSPTTLRLLTVALLSTASAFAGYIVNSKILSRYYIFQSYSATSLGIQDLSNAGPMLYGFLHQFGFRKDVPMLSSLGILSIGGILAAIYLLCFTAKTLKHLVRDNDLRKYIVFSVFLCYSFIMTVLFLITATVGGYHYPLYYSLCLPWAAPVAVWAATSFPNEVHPFHFKRLFSWVTVLILLFNGLANTAFYNGHQSFAQPYEGLSFQNAQKAAQMAGVVQFLCENDYDGGYATFWEGNILTELSDGQLPVTNITADYHADGQPVVSSYPWLTSLWQREVRKEKPFLLLEPSANSLFEESSFYQYCSLVYSDPHHYIYNIDNQEEFLLSLR